MTSPPEDALVGLDVGSTGCRAVLVDLEGAQIACEAVPTPWVPVATGAEMTAASLLGACLDVVHRVVANQRRRVIGVGVSSIAESGVLLDEHDAPVSDIIAWYDTRGSQDADELAHDLGPLDYSGHVGLPPWPVSSLVKYRWLCRHTPDARRGRRWLSVAEWIVSALGGDACAELSLASRTGFVDLESRAPWDPSLQWARAPASLLPPLTPAGTPLGVVSSSSAAPAAMHGATLACGGVDHLCAVVGSGVTHVGDEVESFGTSRAIIRAVPPFTSRADVGQLVASGCTVGWHTMPEQQVVVLGSRSGLGLHRVLEQLGADGERFALVDRTAATLPSSGTGVRVKGIDAGTPEVLTSSGAGSPSAIWRAAVEAAEQDAEAAHRTLDAHVGPPRRRIRTGGWWRSATVRAVRAGQRDGSTEKASVEAAGRGAALLAGLAAGVYSNLDEMRAVAERLDESQATQRPTEASAPA